MPGSAVYPLRERNCVSFGELKKSLPRQEPGPADVFLSLPVLSYTDGVDADGNLRIPKTRSPHPQQTSPRGYGTTWTVTSCRKLALPVQVPIMGFSNRSPGTATLLACALKSAKYINTFTQYIFYSVYIHMLYIHISYILYINVFIHSQIIIILLVYYVIKYAQNIN